jgi:hypothetical protein
MALRAPVSTAPVDTATLTAEERKALALERARKRVEESTRRIELKVKEESLRRQAEAGAAAAAAGTSPHGSTMASASSQHSSRSPLPSPGRRVSPTPSTGSATELARFQESSELLKRGGSLTKDVRTFKDRDDFEFKRARSLQQKVPSKTELFSMSQEQLRELALRKTGSESSLVGASEDRIMRRRSTGRSEDFASSQDSGGRDASNIPNWTVRDVCSWLDSKGFPQYQQLFATEGVDGSVLLSLKTKQLQSMGIKQEDFNALFAEVKLLQLQAPASFTANAPNLVVDGPTGDSKSPKQRRSRIMEEVGDELVRMQDDLKASNTMRQSRFDSKESNQAHRGSRPSSRGSEGSFVSMGAEDAEAMTFV